jgi:Antibiotic biosynthesis monooxygenase
MGGQNVFARVNFLQTTSERIADVARVVRDLVHPGIRDEPGYVGYVVLGDPETGKALGVTLWQSEAHRERSDEKARQIRPRVEQATGGTMQSVEEYEVLFFDVRPE